MGEAQHCSQQPTSMLDKSVTLLGLLAQLPPTERRETAVRMSTLRVWKTMVFTVAKIWDGLLCNSE